MEPPIDFLPEEEPTEGGASKRIPWWRNWKVMLPLWIGIGGMVWLGLYFNVDRSVIAGSVVVVGLLSNAFAWLLWLIALVLLNRACPGQKKATRCSREKSRLRG